MDPSATGTQRLFADFCISTAQSEAILVHNFFDGLSTDTTLPDATKKVMWQLFRLFSFYTINKNGRDFVRSNSIPNQQLDIIADTEIVTLMQAIRPHAVRLADSWKFPDYLLDRQVGILNWVCNSSANVSCLVHWDDMMEMFTRICSTALTD